MFQNLINLQIVLYLLILISASGCAPKERVPLVVFAAGSLIKPFDEMEKAFEARNPYIDVLPEYHGSIQVIRHVTELHEKIDVVASADYALMPMLMYESKDPETNMAYANWCLRFASNKMALAYTPSSQYADEISEKNWFEVLSRPGVRVGLADPRFDASGYRTLMVYKLAEDYYGLDNIFSNMFWGKFEYPIYATEMDGTWVIKVPEIVETKKESGVVLRGSSIMLIALLESGDLDYAFEYESVIQQHGFNLLSLPDEINLGVDAFKEKYNKVIVNLDFKRFASVKPEFKGERIYYGITIPSNAPHPKEAEKFIQFLLGEEGQKVMGAVYHPLLNPVIVDHKDRLPELITKLPNIESE